MTNDIGLELSFCFEQIFFLASRQQSVEHEDNIDFSQLQFIELCDRGVVVAKVH